MFYPRLYFVAKRAEDATFNFFAQKSCAERNFIYLCSPFRGYPLRKNNMVVVAQLVRALVCGTRGHGFESHLPPHKLGCSQVVRHRILIPAFRRFESFHPSQNTVDEIFLLCFLFFCHFPKILMIYLLT